MSKSESEIPPPYIQVNLSQSQNTTTNKPTVIWWQRWLIYGGSTLFAIAAIICGVFTIVGFNIYNLFAGLILIAIGLLVIALEVPIFCSCVRFIEPIAKFSQNRKPWQKMIIYMLPPIPVLILSQDVSPIIGCIFIWLVAFIYFYIFIRRDKN